MWRALRTKRTVNYRGDVIDEVDPEIVFYYCAVIVSPIIGLRTGEICYIQFPTSLMYLLPFVTMVAANILAIKESDSNIKK